MNMLRTRKGVNTCSWPGHRASDLIWCPRLVACYINGFGDSGHRSTVLWGLVHEGVADLAFLRCAIGAAFCELRHFPAVMTHL